MDINEKYGEFTEERGTVFNDIEQFLQMILVYFEDMEENRKFKRHVIATAKLQPLIESLCLLHALYGYPEKNDTQGNTD